MHGPMESMPEQRVGEGVVIELRLLVALVTYLCMLYRVAWPGELEPSDEGAAANAPNGALANRVRPRFSTSRRIRYLPFIEHLSSVTLTETLSVHKHDKSEEVLCW